MPTLTGTEREAIRNLRGRNARWRFARWVLVAYGVGLSVFGGVLVYRATRTIDSVATGPSDVAIPLASILTTQLVLAVIMFLVGAGIAVWVVGRWRGNSVHQLLLKIFEDLSNE